MKLYNPTHFGLVDKQQSYSGVYKFIIPSFWSSGEYVVTVKANVYQNLFENGDHGNNEMKKSIAVQQLVPDLEVGMVEFVLPTLSTER